MSAVLAVPRRPARRPFGAPEALGAWSAVAFLVSVAALTLPRVQSVLRPAPSHATFDGAAQLLLVLLAGSVGLHLASAARQVARRHAFNPIPRARIAPALATIAAGLAAPAVIPLRYALAAGRPHVDMAEGVVALLCLAAGVALVCIGLDGLARARAGEVTTFPPQGRGPRRPIVSRTVERSATPHLSPMDIVAVGSPPPGHAWGLAFQTWLPPIPRAQSVRSAVLGAAASSRSLRDPVLARPFQLLVLFAGMAPVVWLVLRSLGLVGR